MASTNTLSTSTGYQILSAIPDQPSDVVGQVSRTLGVSMGTSSTLNLVLNMSNAFYVGVTPTGANAELVSVANTLNTDGTLAMISPSSTPAGTLRLTRVNALTQAQDLMLHILARS